MSEFIDLIAFLIVNLLYLVALVFILVFINKQSRSIWKAPTHTRLYRSGLLAVLVSAVSAAYFFTFRFHFFANPNTQVFGFPCPYLIFQRVSIDAPWRDFGGPISFVAYPINLSIFLFFGVCLLWLTKLLSQKRQCASA
ncbi:hypothetical protein [Geothrix sp.]|jgi:hypothetical protein|uniref:hypothetical protein n=1 Tax=Geothrix sp. TaxID=1962974 RepID=UPI0025C39320|nr:hypothetical protein [Geothrix sp.]